MSITNTLVRILFFFLASSLFIGIGQGQKILDVTKYGAMGDGRADDSQAFFKAWKDLCQGNNDATDDIPILIVPEGKTYLLQRIKFEGPCNSKSVHVQILGNLLAPVRGAWKECDSGDWLSFSNIENLMLDGSGKIDGQGAAWWSTSQYNARSRKLLANNDCKPNKALQFHNCQNLKLSGLTFLNSPQAHIGINSCDNADVSDLNIHAPEDSPNTDGIDISSSTHVTIRNSFIGTGDDCIAIGDGCSFLYITKIACGPGHGISVGSLGEDGASNKVDNIYVKDCSFTGTTNGARIKTWQGGSGYARNITFERIKLDRAKYPIIIDQYYCNGEHNCKSQSSAVVVADVTYNDFEGTSATDEAIKLNCDKVSGGCHNILMDKINIVPAVGDMKIFASCNNADGTYVGTTVPDVACLKSSTTEPTTPTTPSSPKTSAPPVQILPLPSPPPIPVMPLLSPSPVPVMPLPSPSPVPVMPLPSPSPVPVMPLPSPSPVPIIPPPARPPVTVIPPPSRPPVSVIPPQPFTPPQSTAPPVPRGLDITGGAGEAGELDPSYFPSGAPGSANLPISYYLFCPLMVVLTATTIIFREN
ncbi:hypothetical protein ACFXTI_016374 [Malus domestica]